MKYNVNRNIVSIYENLPSGGGKQVFASNYEYLKKIFKTKYLTDKKETKKISNILEYMYYIYVLQRRIHEKILLNVGRHDLLIAYHSWVTKSPYLLRLSRIPTVYVCNETPREFYDSNYIRTFNLKERFINLIRLQVKSDDFENIASNKKLTVIANSQYTANNIKKAYGVSSIVIRPGVKYAQFGVLNQYDNRKNQIICVGSINKLKNQKLLIESVACIAAKKRPKVILVGNGGDKKYIQMLTKLAKLSKTNLEIKLNIGNKDLINEYKKSKVFFYCPLNEPFGIVILEAMCAGLPLVVYKHGGGYSEVISKKNGLLIKDVNPKSYATAIKKVMDGREIWERYSNYNYNYSHKFSIDKMNKLLGEQILKILE